MHNYAAERRLTCRSRPTIRGENDQSVHAVAQSGFRGPAAIWFQPSWLCVASLLSPRERHLSAEIAHP